MLRNTENFFTGKGPMLLVSQAVLANHNMPGHSNSDQDSTDGLPLLLFDELTPRAGAIDSYGHIDTAKSMRSESFIQWPIPAADVIDRFLTVLSPSRDERVGHN